MCHWSSAFLHEAVKLIVLAVSNNTFMSAVISSSSSSSSSSSLLYLSDITRAVIG